MKAKMRDMAMGKPVELTAGEMETYNCCFSEGEN